jgi:hypothetical protein
MQPLDPAIESLPPLMRVFIYGVALISTAILAFWKYRDAFNQKPSSTASDLVVAGASLADMKPVREISATLVNIDNKLERLVDLLEKKVGFDAEGTEALQGILNQMKEEASYQRGVNDGRAGRH